MGHGVTYLVQTRAHGITTAFMSGQYMTTSKQKQISWLRPVRGTQTYTYDLNVMTIKLCYPRGSFANKVECMINRMAQVTKVCLVDNLRTDHPISCCSSADQQCPQLMRNGAAKVTEMKNGLGNISEWVDPTTWNTIAEHEFLAL